jgi:hypothetical protein
MIGRNGVSQNRYLVRHVVHLEVVIVFGAAICVGPSA